MQPNKTCPFCGTEALVIGFERSECKPCGYSVPTDKWLNQRDIVHIIGGSAWATNGHVIVRDQIPEHHRSVLLSDLLSVVNQGEWFDAIPDGYCKAANTFCHRFKVGDDVVFVDAKHEDYLDDHDNGTFIRLLDCTMKARKVPSGFIVCYSAGEDNEPVLYVASMKTDVLEEK